jgi:hypothetical protein
MKGNHQKDQSNHHAEVPVKIEKLIEEKVNFPFAHFP